MGGGRRGGGGGRVASPNQVYNATLSYMYYDVFNIHALPS